MSPIPWTMNAEIFPLEVRAKAMGVTTMVNWLGNYAMSATFLDVAEALSTSRTCPSAHPDGAFFLYSAISAGFWVWFFFKAPETKGLHLHEIAALFDPKGANLHELTDVEESRQRASSGSFVRTHSFGNSK
mmetsp:Transcript_28471/g.64685  ORF Transcript_28471/g.64685 Transcript_28471/m.64685 type:complete len:131 (+) Transcript_28471:1157-1549(+)